MAVLVVLCSRTWTEAILALVGPGSGALRADFFRDAVPTIAAHSRLWLPCYKHLGGKLHHSGSLIKELRYRVALAWGAFNKRRKKIFASSYGVLSDKALLMDFLVLSVLLYGAGTWPQLTTAEEQCVASAYFQMACHLLRPGYDVLRTRRLGQARVLALAGLTTLPTRLHLARLRHLTSCAIDSIPEFWAFYYGFSNL